MSEVSFHFDDRIYKGHYGEPMAAALLRNGVLSFTKSIQIERAGIREASTGINTIWFIQAVEKNPEFTAILKTKSIKLT